MKQIPLTRGYVALVDDCHYEELAKHNWYCYEGPQGRYAVRKKKIDGKVETIRMHRVITNCPNGMVVDHINHDGLDNQITNLRVCTHGQNRLNRVVAPKNETGFIGVSYNWRCKSKPYHAKFQTGGKVAYLGYFSTAEEAARARDDYARQSESAEFVLFNFPIAEAP